MDIDVLQKIADIEHPEKSRTLWEVAKDYLPDYHDRMHAFLERAEEACGQIHPCVYTGWLYSPRTYAQILLHMHENKIPSDVVDIGCNTGFPSEFFNNYMGIDTGEGLYRFNSDKKGVQYINSFEFPNNSPFMDARDLVKDKTVLSIMALGMEEPCGRNVARRCESRYHWHCDNLKGAKHIYVRTKKEPTEKREVTFAQVLKSRFRCESLKLLTEADANPNREVLYIQP